MTEPSGTDSSGAGSRPVPISVVVPTYRRAPLLDRCLAALVQQKLERDSYEILVVDDGPDTPTRGVVEAWARHPDAPRIRYRTVAGRHGPAAARNIGWREAAGGIIAFTDDDCVPSPDWLPTGLRAMRDGVTGMMGQILVPLPANPTDYERSVAGLEQAEFVTANCFYRRTALAAVGGFDERFTHAWREDADLFFTLLEAGHRLIRVPEAVVIHPVRPAPWGVSLKLQRLSAFNALLYKKHPRLYRARIQPRPPWRYYATVLALLLLLGGSIVGRPALAGAAAAAWLLFTMQFTAARLRRTSRRPAHVAEMLVTSALIPPLSVFWRLAGAVMYRVAFL